MMPGKAKCGSSQMNEVNSIAVIGAGTMGWCICSTIQVAARF